MTANIKIHITANFENNLESIRCYFQQHTSAQADKFEELLDKLFDTIIPNLQVHPEIGVDFLLQKVNSIEELRQVANIKEKLSANTSIRLYNDRDYKLLYSLQANEIALLSIKHHKQLYFDLKHQL
jgi:hypothetical protein